VKVHDVRLAAAMNIHGVTSLLTLNAADFAPYEHVSAVQPGALA
jgi:hypothetical protein